MYIKLKDCYHNFRLIKRYKRIDNFLWIWYLDGEILSIDYPSKDKVENVIRFINSSINSFGYTDEDKQI